MSGWGGGGGAGKGGDVCAKLIELQQIPLILLRRLVPLQSCVRFAIDSLDRLFQNIVQLWLTIHCII